MRIPVQSSVLSTMTPLRVCVFLAVMAGDCGDEISSKYQTAPSGHHIMCDFRDSSQSLLFSCNFTFEMFTPVRLYHSFSYLFRDFREFSQCSLAKIPTSLKFLLPNHDTSYTQLQFSRDSFMSRLILHPFFFQCSLRHYLSHKA